MNKQLFPVFHPVTESFLFYKERDLVHVHGDWHRGIQANIIRRNARGTFDILIQTRSNTVDIGKNKFDQSLAVQMIDKDNLDERNTLSRGLLQELGIKSFSYTKIETTLRIIKTYDDDHEKRNHELLTLFLVALEKPEELHISSPKVRSLQWMEWYAFLDVFQANNDRFTKTGRFYFETRALCQQIEDESYRFLKVRKKRASGSDTSLADKLLLYINKRDQSIKTYIFDKSDHKQLEEHLAIYVSLENAYQ